MNVDQLKDFFESNNFNVHLYEQDSIQCGEIESWTDGGVDMIIDINPFSVESFTKCVEDFDIDSEIDVHRQDKTYVSAFSIKASLKDFGKYHKYLKGLAKELIGKI